MSYQIRTKEILQTNIDLKRAMLADKKLLAKLETVVNWSIETFRADGKLLFCGNGGSAADAQHLAAEFSGRFYKDRPPLFAEALHVNTSFFTAVCNDYSFD
ncbi:MAG: SIS domain-containing protein, partial [Bacteroidota bacterium]